MKALLCKTLGLPDTLLLEEIPDPQPGPGQVLLEMRAAGVNFPDALVIQGKYQFKPALPFTPGSELAGVVLAVGAGVTNVCPGQRVIASCQLGAFAEKVLVDARQVLPMPPGLGFDVAAAFTLAYGTSYHALKGRGALKAGQTLLVLGASGGVGLAALQIGKALGARVIAAASSADKLALCQSNGADALINYHTEDLRTRLKELTDGKGPDVIYDPVGGHYAEPAFRSIAWGGRYLVVGFANGDIPALPLNLPLLKGASVVGVFWGEFVKRQLPDFIQDLGEMFKLLAQGKLRPYISKSYPLAQGAQALQDLLERTVTGKVIITNGDVKEASASSTPAGVATAGPTATSTTDTSALPQAIRPTDLTQWVGRELGVSSWITLDQARIDAFAQCTQDHQWIHVDEQRAALESPFGGTVAHAFLSLSMIPVTVYELLEGRLQVKATLNYGLDKTRFMAPVRSGQRVRNHIKVVALQDKGQGRWLLTTENTFEIEGQDKPALVATTLAYLME
ncbi:MAG: zinc-binding dehydrogenase [Rhodoferax sp.]|nr:zinc-binding dehydrogenase [Rhodoferax sp.]